MKLFFKAFLFIKYSLYLRDKIELYRLGIYLLLLLVNVCKQTFNKSHMRISQKVKGVLM